MSRCELCLTVTSPNCNNGLLTVYPYPLRFVFTDRQIARILPKAVDALVDGDPDEARTWAEELEISSARRDPEILSGEICSETLRLLNSEAKEGRLHARQIITDALLNPVNIDESGEMIASLLRTWREDLVATLRTIEGIDQVALRGDAIDIIPNKNQSGFALERIEQFVEHELEHADWLMTVITSRAALYRADLEEIVVTLSDFCAQRSDCSLLLNAPSSKLAQRIGPLKLSTINEDEFLVEILSAIEGHLGALSQEYLPAAVTDIVERQLLYPSEAPVYYEQLARLVLESDALRSTYPESETLNSDELSAEIKSRAERLMRIIERESLVLYERATYKAQRCATLARISSYGSSTQTQLAKMVAQTSEELRFFVSSEEAHRRHLESFRDRLHELGGTDASAWRIDRPHVFMLFIPGEDTIRGDDLALVCKVCMAEYEEPDPEEDFDEESVDDTGFGGEYESEYGDEIDDELTELEGAEPLGYIGNEDDFDEPLEFHLIPLRPRGGDLLTEGERLAIWFARLEAALTSLSSEKLHSEKDTGGPLGGDHENTEWRYYGMSQRRCERLFRPFFDLIETRYPLVWKLLPQESREQLSLIDISTMSPLRQVTDLFELLEEYYPDLTEFTPAQNKALQKWMSSYTMLWDAPTMDALLSIPMWGRASKLFKVGRDREWQVSQREDLLDEHQAFLSSHFFSPELHLLLHAASERGMETMNELLRDGLVFLDGVSEAFVACLNTIPADELKERIHHRAKPALKEGSLSSFWEPIPHQHARDSLVALRTHFGSIWIDIHRSYTRGLL